MMYYPDFSHIFSTLVPVMFSFSSLISLVLYVLGSIGLYSMARNTGVRNPWFAWIPIARDFLLGSLADRYNSTAMRKNTSLHLWLTILSGIQTPLFYFLVIIAIVLSPLFYNVPILLLALLLFLFLASLVGIAYKVFYLLSFYYVTMDYEPSRAVLYTVLAFFDLGGILLFLSRHNVPVGIAGRCYPVQPKYNVH